MFNKIKKISFILTFLLLLPLISFAAVLGKTDTLLTTAKDIVTKTLIPLVFVLALLFFFWGMAKYIWSVGDGKDEGKKIMIWGIIALFVMASVWGLVAFLQTEFLGSSGPTTVPIPTIGGNGNNGNGGGSGGGGGIPPQIEL